MLCLHPQSTRSSVLPSLASPLQFYRTPRRVLGPGLARPTPSTAKLHSTPHLPTQPLAWLPAQHAERTPPSRSPWRPARPHRPLAPRPARAHVRPPRRRAHPRVHTRHARHVPARTCAVDAPPALFSRAVRPPPRAAPTHRSRRRCSRHRHRCSRHRGCAPPRHHPAHFLPFLAFGSSGGSGAGAYVAISPLVCATAAA